MLNGIILVREAILSMDLRSTLSQYYKIVKVYKCCEDLSSISPDIDFIIIDCDPYSRKELRTILKNLKLSSKLKIIALTSDDDNLSLGNYQYKIISKPIDYRTIMDFLNEPSPKNVT
jgi:hypothetical protein